MSLSLIKLGSLQTSECSTASSGSIHGGVVLEMLSKWCHGNRTDNQKWLSKVFFTSAEGRFADKRSGSKHTEWEV